MDVERILTELGLDIARTRGKEISAHCPFHDDRHPGFSINQETGAWICYSRCGGGGVQELVARVLNINHAKARQWLKERGQPSGARINRIRAGKGRLARARVPKKEHQPCPPFDIKHVRPWVLERGFSEAILKEYQCGTSYFYDALVIPVLQSRAYIYRRAPGREPKYKFTRGFRSHNTLYGLHNVELDEDGSLILVEGPLDCLWLRQHGYQNSLAIMGGGRLGREQARIIKQDLRPKKVILAFDNDEGGQETTEKSLVSLRGIDCYVVQWEGVEWPDEDDEDLTIVPNDVAELDEGQLTELLRAAKLTARPPRKAIETSWIARTYRPGGDDTKKKVRGRSP